MRLTEAEYRAMQQRRGAPQPVAPPAPHQCPADTSVEALFVRIRVAAKTHGWVGLHTYNAHGPDTGLHVFLVRRGVALHAEISADGVPLTASQQRWLEVLRPVAGMEVYHWTPKDQEAILARLART